MNEKIMKLAYEEALCDLMMELCICESDAKRRITELLKTNPKYLEPWYAQFYKIRHQMNLESV